MADSHAVAEGEGEESPDGEASSLSSGRRTSFDPSNVTSVSANNRPTTEALLEIST